MNAIERGLSRPIPLEKAASFFIGLKSWCRPSPAEDELMAECVKQAAALEERTVSKPKASLTPTEATDLESLEMRRLGVEGVNRDHARQNAFIMENLGALDELHNAPENMPRRTLGTALAGGGLGALNGAAVGGLLGGGKGALLGGGLGAAAGALLNKQRPADYKFDPKAYPQIEHAGPHGTKFKEDFAANLPAEWKTASADQVPQKTPLAQEAPADAAAVDPQPHLNVKSAALRFRLLANSFKKQAADETAPSEDSGDAQLASPTPAEVPAQDAYLANEQQGMEAENAAAVEYYQAQLEQARAETAAAQEQAQQAQAQVEQLTMAQEQHDSQVAAANQEGQIAQQAAVQQVDAANLAASQAMNQAVQASNQALQAKSQETAAKIEVQQVRTQLFDMAAQGLPGTEPALGAGGAAEGVEPLQPTATPEAGAEGAPAEEGAEGGEGAGSEEAATEDGNAQDAEEQAGAPDSGQNQDAQSASGDGMPGSQGATEQAASASPGSVAPQGDGGSQGVEGSPPQANSSSGGGGSGSSSSDAKRQGQISIKVGSASERRARLAAQLPWLAKTAGLGAEGIGALAGGALGAGAAALEGAGHGPDLDKMRSGIAEREAAPKRTGLRGFADALSLVQDKARLGLGEATQAHPIPATIVGGLGGAALGASAGPKIRDLVREAASLHRGA